MKGSKVYQVTWREDRLEKAVNVILWIKQSQVIKI